MGLPTADVTQILAQGTRIGNNAAGRETNSSMTTALIICPGRRDRLNLADERILEHYGLLLAGQDRLGAGFDPAAFADQVVEAAPAVDGVFG